MNKDNVKHILLAILGPTSIITIVAIMLLPAPPGGMPTMLSLALSIFCYSLLGPAAYLFMFHHPFALDAPSMIVLLASLTSVILLATWLFKAKAPAALLYLSTTLWIAFGGVTTLAGILASI
jgi:hypothetical protein|tara:strand:+ start:249 stop:614 length:366 start_codon:yes stop_codon:yes gene_type:complete